MLARRSRPLALLLLLFYWAVSLRHLAVVPPAYEDEPWQASTGWKLATDGVFGSDMFAGYYGMEHHYYAFMPVHPLLLAATFKAAGLGLFQARFETVILGLIVLALTFALGDRLFNSRVGALALLLMLLVRFTASTPSQVSGIVLIDLARISRYDIAVPVFGLAALQAYLRARREPASRWGLLAGFLAGLAGLSHLHGLLWGAGLGLLMVNDRVGRRSAAGLALGFAAPWLLYLFYGLGGLPDWLGQVREYAPRFGLLDPIWYVSNLAGEWRRYSPGIDLADRGSLLRPGFWGVAVAWPASILALAWQTWKRNDQQARLLLIMALALPAGFALLIQSKLSNYLIAILPLGALAVAWGGLRLWHWAGRVPHGGWTRGALAALLLAAGAEGLARMVALEAAAGRTTPYADFIGRVRAEIPAGARVLGLHNYWLGLDDLDYRAWPVPLWQADPAHRSPPLTIDEALDGIAPDAILIDPRMRAFFEGGQGAALVWMEQRGFVLSAVVEDATYGRMEIYLAPP